MLNLSGIQIPTVFEYETCYNFGFPCNNINNKAYWKVALNESWSVCLGAVNKWRHTKLIQFQPCSIHPVSHLRAWVVTPGLHVYISRAACSEDPLTEHVWYSDAKIFRKPNCSLFGILINPVIVRSDFGSPQYINTLFDFYYFCTHQCFGSPLYFSCTGRNKKDFFYRNATY